MTEEINKGCEFQSDCIEYKDISYLKIMPICAIYELSIACGHKVDKCKYYKLYKQLQRLKQENETIINEYNKLQAEIIGDIEFKELMFTGITPLKVLQNLKLRNRELQAFYDVHESFKTDFDTNRKLLDNYRSALEEIKNDLKEICKAECDYTKAKFCGDCDCIYGQILTKINEVLK